MKINDMDIFIGAYAERNHNKHSKLSVSEEQAEAITTGIKEAFHSLNLQNRGVKVSISKEDVDFLCSEEGFQKMKQDALELYAKNENRQKVIAKGRNPEDLFWSNTGNQWLMFSEALYRDGFYDGMSDDEVKKFEDNLAYITMGMDNISRSQYLTGMEFSSIQEEYNYFMSSGEAIIELESSVAALRYLSDTVLPDEYQESFGNLIDMYYTHNNEVLSEYKNPMESFNKVIAGIHSKKNANSALLDNVAEEPVGEYKYTIMLGMMEQSEKEKAQYREDLTVLFGEVGNSINVTDIWEQIEDRFLKYSTGNSDDEGFKNYVLGQAQYLFNHMKKCWEMLLR